MTPGAFIFALERLMNLLIFWFMIQNSANRAPRGAKPILSPGCIYLVSPCALLLLQKKKEELETSSPM
jgi:hypothetical protein